MTTPAELTRSEFATLAGYKPSYVTELAKAGRLVLTEDGKRVRVAESLALIEATRDPARQGVADRHAAARAALEPAAEGEPTGDDADEPVGASAEQNSHAVRRARALADDAEESARRKRRENDIEEGKLLWRADVEPAVSLAFSRLRQALESLCSELPPELSAIDDEDRIRAVLTERVERLLSDLSRELSQLAKHA